MLTTSTPLVMMVSGGPELGNRKKNTFLITHYNYSITHEPHSSPNFPPYYQLYIESERKKSRRLVAHISSLHCQDTVTIKPAGPILGLSKKKRFRRAKLCSDFILSPKLKLQIVKLFLKNCSLSKDKKWTLVQGSSDYSMFCYALKSEFSCNSQRQKKCLTEQQFQYSVLK